MRRIIFLILIGGFACLHLHAHVELKFPEGGETFSPGDTVTVTWIETVRHNTLDWDLLYSLDGGQTWIIMKADLPLELLTYDWVVPEVSSINARIKVIQDNVDGDYESTSPNFTIAAMTGISYPAKNKEIRVFPNPFTEFASIDFENPENHKLCLTIFNINGQVVWSESNISFTQIGLRRGSLAAGQYLLRLSDDKNIRATGRIVIL